jgi:hypothetical protein
MQRTMQPPLLLAATAVHFSQLSTANVFVECNNRNKQH